MIGTRVTFAKKDAALFADEVKRRVAGCFVEQEVSDKANGSVMTISPLMAILWKITHNVIHHTDSNIHGLDESLTVSPLLRISPRADRRHPRAEIAMLFAGKGSFCLWAVVIPLLVLHVSWWQFLVGFMAINLTAGALLGIVFQLAHVVEATTHPEPGPAGAIPEISLAHELATTSNSGRRNRLLCWYAGGLDFQVEHHLFPKVCSIHYPAISGIVREVAEAHGLPCNRHRTLRDAIRSHYQALRQLGRPQAFAAAGAVV